jgi:hypothetical protein
MCKGSEGKKKSIKHNSLKGVHINLSETKTLFADISSTYRSVSSSPTENLFRVCCGYQLSTIWSFQFLVPSICHNRSKIVSDSRHVFRPSTRLHDFFVLRTVIRLRMRTITLQGKTTGAWSWPLPRIYTEHKWWTFLYSQLLGYYLRQFLLKLQG